MKNVSLKALFATVILAAASTSALAADDSPAAQRVQEAVSSHQIIGQSQSPATGQQSFSETGMSVAAGRVEQSLNAQSLKGSSTASLTSANPVVNDQGKSVAASRVQQSLSDNA
ncbi:MULTISPECIES: hypothetical protein [Cobetia]|uniref:DUF4148 domain-containing protein n=1 Tax=Cobetia crustatorum TaxID=553385 RepID=A0A558HWR6_9GAMM|nr:MULTISPECIES: hypothetical protein [Cobetia]TVU73566.1 hypothetical protein FQP86_00325 [Cobetia crustatorum]